MTIKESSRKQVIILTSEINFNTIIPQAYIHISNINCHMLGLPIWKIYSHNNVDLSTSIK